MASFNNTNPQAEELPVEKDNLYYREFTLLSAQEIIAEALKRRNATYEQMDEFLDKEKGFTQALLDEGEKLDLKVLSDCLYVLGYEVRLNAKLISKGT